MSRATALTGYSLEADLSATADARSRVGLEVRRIVATLVDPTHDEICAEYHQRQRFDPRLPHVTDQRIRSATARVNQAGDIVAGLLPGVSANGHKATRWVLATPTSIQ